MPHVAPDQGVEPAHGVARVPAPLLVLAGIGSLQFGAAFSTTLFERTGASGASLLRVAISALILLVFFRPRVRGLGAAQWRAVVIFGLVLGAMNTTFYESLERLPLGTAVTIEFIGPLGVAAWLSRRPLDLLVALVALAGIVLITDPFGKPADGVGVMFAMLAGVCWGTYILVAQRAGRVFEGAGVVAIAMTIAIAVPLVPGVVQGGAVLFRPEVLAVAAAVALLSSAIPYSVETEALRRIDARVFGILMSLEPAVAALAGLLVLGQKLGARELAGMVLVVCASIAVTRTTAAAEA